MCTRYIGGHDRKPWVNGEECIRIVTDGLAPPSIPQD